MRCNISHLAVLFTLTVLSSDTRALKTLEEVNAETACREISSVISIQSAVLLPGKWYTHIIHYSKLSLNHCVTGSSQYEKDTSHYAASSSQRSACSVEPGNVDDIAKIVSCYILRKQWTPELLGSYVSLHEIVFHSRYDSVDWPNPSLS